MPLYATGHNQPGYLPDDGTSFVTRDWQRARDSLVEDLRMAAEELAALQPDTPWQATVAGQAWRLDDLGDHCPNCGYPLAQHGWPAAHRRPADGHPCELGFDDDGTLTA